jgi:HNH endonuclease
MRVGKSWNQRPHDPPHGQDGGEAMSDLERFNNNWIPVTESGCWLWIGGCIRNGYGAFYVAKKQILAHRYSYLVRHGSIPQGLQLDHLCRVPSCVNPDHLEIVTSRVNTLRGLSPSAMNARKTHCQNGHLFTDANTYYARDKSRRCRECTLQWIRDKNIKRKIQLCAIMNQ